MADINGSIVWINMLPEDSLETALDFSNQYAPEHLIMSVSDSDRYVDKIQNAGSVFLGNYSPESAGDYATGTNHSLPTYGYARAIGGVGVDAFMKGITYQKLSIEGLQSIGKSVITLAETESLQGHANSIKIRLENENK